MKEDAELESPVLIVQAAREIRCFRGLKALGTKHPSPKQALENTQTIYVPRSFLKMGMGMFLPAKVITNGVLVHSPFLCR